MTFTATAWGRVYLDDPKAPFSVDRTELAASLGRITRYAGSYPISVLHHSLAVAELVAQRNGSLSAYLYALLHDAHEAIVGDVPTPVLRLIDSDELEALKTRLDSQILKAFGCRPSLQDRQIVATADHDIFLYEVFHLIGKPGLFFDEVPNKPPFNSHISRLYQYPRRTAVEAWLRTVSQPR